MSEAAQASINDALRHRLRCSKCGGATTLARIEPAEDSGHDLRTFECVVCGNTETMTMRFK